MAYLQGIAAMHCPSPFYLAA